jgi:hypothetical protein
MGIRWSKFSLQGEEETASRLAPFIFPEIMSRTDSFLTRDTRRGAVASFYVYINFSGESRTWTCAYRTVSSYLTCPSITSGPSIDFLRAEESHRCFNRQPPKPVASPKMNIESCYHPRVEPAASFNSTASEGAGKAAENSASFRRLGRLHVTADRPRTGLRRPRWCWAERPIQPQLLRVGDEPVDEERHQ